jgi:hypothetical protein
VKRDSFSVREKQHGYIFEVPAGATDALAVYNQGPPLSVEDQALKS